MRRTLAVTALAAAAVGFGAPAASAGGCYGVADYATACYTGDVYPTFHPTPFCVYTGGSTCETYYVPVPGVGGGIDYVQVCVLRACTY